LDDEGEETLSRRLLQAKEEDVTAQSSTAGGGEETESAEVESVKEEAEGTGAEEEAPILSRKKSKTRRVIGDEEE